MKYPKRNSHVYRVYKPCFFTYLFWIVKITKIFRIFSSINSIFAFGDKDCLADQQARLMFWYYPFTMFTINEVASAAEPLEEQVEMSEGGEKYNKNTTKITGDFHVCCLGTRFL